jgi:membrane associated rhomboid family serine protease
MDTPHSGISTEESAEEHCYGHPGTPTRLHCTRCERPICGRCAIPASVGQHCPECVAAARRSAPRVHGVLRATAPATYGLIVANVVCYVAQQLVPGFTPALIASSPDIAAGDWYRLITSMFLHAGIWHIGFNMLALYYFGPTVEQAFGTPRFVALYMATGFFASVASYLFSPLLTQSLGASGAIFGIFAVVMVLAFNRRRDPGANEMLRSLLGLLVLNMALVLFVHNINLWAHAGGFLSGIALGAAYDQFARRPASTVVQVAATAAVVVAGIALTVVRTTSIHQSPFF